MLKQLHKNLLEKYPLLWNTRAITFLLVILGVHLVHLLLGYLSFSSIADIGWSDPENMFFNGRVVFFSITGSFVVFVLWLVRYFRNNAFKSFYPFSKGKLFAEFLIVFVISLLNVTYYYSYTVGFVLHVQTATDYTMAVKDKEAYLLIAPLLKEGKDAYALDNRCFPAPFPVQRQYLADTVRRKDSTGAMVSAKEPKVQYTGSDQRIYTAADIDKLTGGVAFSYLNSCDYAENRQPGIQLLLTNDSELIRNAMNNFTGVCERYHIKYKIDVNKWFRWVYHPPYYPVSYTLHRLSAYNAAYSKEDLNNTEYNPDGFYVEADKLDTMLDHSIRAHRYKVFRDSWLGFLFFALVFSALVYTFRISSRRIWLISLVGICLLGLLTGGISVLLHSPTGVYLLYLLLIGSFLTGAFRSSKTISGVCMVWFVWTAGFILPLLTALYSESEHREYVDGHYTDAPLTEWLSDNHTLFVLICMGVYILIVGLFTPLYRRWQANAED